MCTCGLLSVKCRFVRCVATNGNIDRSVLTRKCSHVSPVPSSPHRSPYRGSPSRRRNNPVPTEESSGALSAPNTPKVRTDLEQTQKHTSSVHLFNYICICLTFKNSFNNHYEKKACCPMLLQQLVISYYCKSIIKITKLLFMTLVKNKYNKCIEIHLFQSKYTTNTFICLSA